jgi:hypothetical protein
VTAPRNINEWRGRTETRLDQLVSAVKGGNGEKGLVNEVADIKITIASYRGRMATFAAVGSFLGSVAAAILVAVILKFVFKV